MLDDQEPRNGRAAKQYPELDSAVTMTVYSRSPEKWMLIDRETGEAYQGNHLGSWDRLDPTIDEEKRAARDKRI